MEDYLARYDRRAVHASRTYDGMVVIEAVLPVGDGEEILGILEACGKAVDGRSRQPRRRADALVELLRSGAPAAERYTLHLVADVDAVADHFGGRVELLAPRWPPRPLRRFACVVPHLVRSRSQPLDIGTRRSVWTVAQRRAITVRDRGRCRFSGCERRTCEIHHVVHYEHGGRTAVDNGILLCPRHHTAVHERASASPASPTAL